MNEFMDFLRDGWEGAGRGSWEGGGGALAVDGRPEDSCGVCQHLLGEGQNS